MDFTPTEIDTYMRCGRKAVLSSKNGQHLTPMSSPLSLQTGTIVHRAHHLWLKDTENKHDLMHHTMTAAVRVQDKLIASYKEKVGTEPDDGEMWTLHESVEFCVSMARNYEFHYGGNKIPEGLVLIAPEQKVRVPIPGTKHHLKCRLDALLYDPKEKEAGILERKTYKQKPNFRAIRRTTQFGWYSWATSRLGLNKTGKPAFVVYDGLWRRNEPPRGKTIADLFARYRFTPNLKRIAEMEKFLPKIVQDMEFLYRHPELAIPSIPWLGCNDCAFNREGSELCDAITECSQPMIKYYLDNKFTLRTDDTDEDEEDGTSE
jgi:hypothetical protein